MAQSALGPGMGIFTGYAKVLEPDDSEMSVRTAIAVINEVRKEILDGEDARYDPETRFCIDWFQAFGTGDGKSGDAIGMASAYNLGLADLEAAGVFHAKGGGVARMHDEFNKPVYRQVRHDKSKESCILSSLRQAQRYTHNGRRIRMLNIIDVESFNARLRDELLDGEIFYTLREAQIVIESWRRHYNAVRPHASIRLPASRPRSVRAGARRLAGVDQTGLLDAAG